MFRYNEDGTITKLMTPEDERVLMEGIIERNAYEDGMKKGMRVGAKDNAKNTAILMIKENIPLETISKVTKISLKELKKLVVK